MNKLKLLLAGIFTVTVLVSGASLLLPQPASAEVREFYSPIATSVVLVDVMLALGSAILFWSAIKHFKPELRNAYRLMAYSTIAVGVGLLIFPYIEYYGLWDNLWFNISSYMQYFIGAPLMYFGVRMFYKKIGLNGKAASLWMAISGIVLLWAINPFLPYNIDWPLTTVQFNLFKVVMIIPLVLYGIAGYMAWRIRQHAGSDYRPAFTWLTVAMVFCVINTLGIALIDVVGYEHLYYTKRLYTTPAILGDLCLLIAGYAFAKIGMSNTVSEKQASSIDIVIHVVGMVSNQSKIDPYLDDMRILTARVEPSRRTSLTDDEQMKLKEIYLQVEHFLVTEDPLRTFSQDKLRADIAQHFGLDKNTTSTFWPLI
jgi:heme/copper-type cytochrome/quinol oxidase subunit 3